MTAVLFGELTADGKNIALVAACEDRELPGVAARLDMLTPHWKPVPESGGRAITVPATWPTVVQLGFSFNGNGHSAWVPQARLQDWIAAEAARRVTPPPQPDGIWPAGLAPRGYQLAGAAAIAAAGKFLLLDDPGLGKTVTAILGLEARRRAGNNIFPLVIVVPSWEVADVWDGHIRTWAPQWPSPVMHAGPNRARIQGWKHRQYILITTYATARKDEPPDRPGILAKIAAEAVIADECHLIRNDKAHQSQAVQRIAAHASTFGGLSGTLIVHNMGDSYPVRAAMDKASWPSRKRDKRRYFTVRDNAAGYGDTITGLRSEMKDEFFGTLLGQVIRRNKAAVLDELPPKVYSIRRPVIPPEWQHAYDTMEADMLAELPDGEELQVMSILAQLTRLSQLASSAADVTITYVLDEETGLEKPHYEVALKRPCWKADVLLEILAERPGMTTTVFTESRQLAMLAGQYCEEAGYRTGYVTGLGDGTEESGRITRGSRRQAVADFQDGELDVIMCTAGAGGLGITLTRSNCAVMMQRSWQLDLALQPEDRVHRLGQLAEQVEIIDIVAKGTVDQRRREVLRDKAGQWSEFARDPDIVRQLLGGLR